jgi:ectoine hydroxylase-related dioxygenase (phytanoyl-CoA dioxygenase family)
MSLTREQKQQLDDAGYLLLPDFMGSELLAELRRRTEELFNAEGGNAGSEFKQEPGCRRLANLMDKGTVFQRVVGNARLLEAMQHVLGPGFKLSSLNVRSVNPHGDEGQPLHADMAAIADEQGYWVCNSVWLLDDFTPANGSLRVVPGSHRWRRLPQNVLDDPRAPHPDEVLLTGRAGDVMVMNAHLWHGGTSNRTAAPRTALHAFFARRDKPQQQYQKQLVRPEVQRQLSQELRWLLALDDPLNDQLSTTATVRSGFLK